MQQEDVLINRLKYTPSEVYDLFTDWWNGEIRKVHDNIIKDYPDRAACDKFLIQYGWDLPSLLISMDLSIDSMVE